MCNGGIFGLSSSCTWIIVLLLVLYCCCGNNGANAANDSGCGCGCSNAPRCGCCD